MLADVAVLQRDEAAIRQYAALAEAWAVRYDHKLYEAIAYRARGVAHRLAGEYVEADARLNQALALFRELGTRWQLGRTYFELGELAQAQKNVAGARDYFLRALAAFEALRAAPDAERTRSALASLSAFD
jgi:tetratricopeptide (TPR) repeat protein